jgi:hypothetical protein
MPSSSKEGKSTIVEWVGSTTDLTTILDIGAGKGTYKNLFSKKRMLSDAKWTAIEVWEPYVKDFNLHSIYNTVINEDARYCNYSSIGPFDLTFMGDVLEHITKEEAVILVDTVMKHSKFAVISIPIVHYPQGEEFNNPYEVHVKDDWTHEEVSETFYKYIKKFKIGSEIGVYWLEA